MVGVAHVRKGFEREREGEAKDSKHEQEHGKKDLGEDPADGSRDE